MRTSDTTPEYNVWKIMRSRCNNPKSTGYKYYGGKGIRVCPEWDSFEQFLKDMGKRPYAEYTLDRKRSKGNYEPTNCRRRALPYRGF